MPVRSSWSEVSCSSKCFFESTGPVWRSGSIQMSGSTACAATLLLAGASSSKSLTSGLSILPLVHSSSLSSIASLRLRPNSFSSRLSRAVTTRRSLTAIFGGPACLLLLRLPLVDRTGRSCTGLPAPCTSDLLTRCISGVVTTGCRVAIRLVSFSYFSRDVKFAEMFAISFFFSLVSRLSLASSASVMSCVAGAPLRLRLPTAAASARSPGSASSTCTPPRSCRALRAQALNAPAPAPQASSKARATSSVSCASSVCARTPHIKARRRGFNAGIVSMAPRML
mmetsp:Transcript_123015/g.359061  ORF Transcript_123015/g.359061 Transcript_123015/m.359061 type:complete len:282 (-) Transcript_123015:46-891(-)